MANDDHDLDDFDIDDGLDIPDFDDSGLEPGGKKREPIERVAGGFLQGVKDTSKSRGFQKKLIESSLPTGYGKAFEDISDAASLGQDLYDSTTSALRPYNRTIKKIGRRVSEKVDKFLPEGLALKLKELTEPDNDRAEDIDPLESKITSELGEIFGAQMQQSAEERASNENRQNIKDVVEEQRHSTNLDVLKMIRSGQDRLVAYQDKITAGYQRKSLEYQIRQLNVSTRQYELLEGHVKENKVQMDSIVKNTALPEFVKLKGSEAAKQIMRQRLLGNMTEGLQKRLAGAGDRFKENLTKRVKAFNQSLVDGIQGAGDAMEMTEGVDIDPLDMAGSMVGGTVLNEAVSPLGQKLGKQLRKIPGVERLGDTLEFSSDNKEEMFRRFLKSQTIEQEERDPNKSDDRSAIQKARDTLAGGTAGIRNSGARFILDMLGPEYSPERVLGEQSALEQAEEVVPFSSMTDRAITEIIPDILTNILHETEMIRTGDDTIGRRIYDVDRRTLRREDDVQKSIMDKVLPEDTLKNIREDMDELLNTLDERGSLSESASESLKRQLFQDMLSGKGFMPERFVEKGGLDEVASEEDAEEIQTLIKARFLDDEGKVRNTDQSRYDRKVIGKKYDYNRSSLPDYQQVITEINALYGPEMLRDMGLVTPDEKVTTSDNLDTKSIIDNITHGTAFTSKAMEAAPGERKRPEIVPEPKVDIDARLEQMQRAAEETRAKERRDEDDRSIKTIMESIDRMVQDTSPIQGPVLRSQEVDENISLSSVMSRVATSVDRLVEMFSTNSTHTVEEYLDLLVDQTKESEEYLDLLVDNVSSLVEVQRAATSEEQFKNVLTAISNIDANDAIDVSNDWLEKIYDQMLKCCGPNGDGPGGGPSGGGSGPGGPGMRFTPLINPPTLKYSRWLDDASKYGTSLVGQTKDAFGQFTDRAEKTLEKAKNIDYKGKVDSAVETVRDFDYKGRAEEAIDSVKNIDLGAAKNRVVDSVKDLNIGPSKDTVVEFLKPLSTRVERVRDSEQVKKLTDRVGTASTRVKDQISELGIEDKIRKMTQLSLGDLDRDALYDRVIDVLNYDYSGRAGDVVDSLKNLSKDDLIDLVKQFDREEAMDTAKSKAEKIGTQVKDRADGAMTRLNAMFQDVQEMDRPTLNLDKVSGVKDALFGVKDKVVDTVTDRVSKSKLAERVRDQSSKLKIPDNVVDLRDFKLKLSPIMESMGMDETKQAVGDGFTRYMGAARSQGSAIGGSIGRGFDRLKESTTESLGDVTRRIRDVDLGKVGDTEVDASNDPNALLSLLKHQADKTLEALNGADVTSEVSHFVDEVGTKTKSLLSDLTGAIRKKMPSKNPASSEVVSEDRVDRGFWSEAWEMLSEIKDHMDRKTDALVEAIQNISFVDGDGTGKPGAFRRLGGKLADGAGGIASYYGKAFSGLGNLVKGGGKGAGSILSGVGSRVGKFIGGKKSIVDIYLEGQEDPIMLARDLRKGRYINRDGGSEVKRLNDIEGDVVDVESGNIIATADDVQNKRLYVIKGGDTEGATLKDVAIKAIDYTTKPSRMLFGLAGKAFTATKDYLNKPQDIYVKGEDKPRLLAVILKSGGYFSAATGKPIYSIDDIDGAVVNRDGNVVLSEADMKEGLVNARGKAIRTGVSGVGSMLGSVARGIGGFYKGAFDLGKKALKKTADFFTGGDGGGFSLIGGSSKKQVEWLEKIYKLLDTRLEEPETVREGSWQQLMNKNPDGTAANDPSMDDGKDGKSNRKSLFDMFSAGSLLDKLNPFSDGGVGIDVDMPGGESRDEKRRRRRNKAKGPGGGKKGGMLNRLWQGTKKHVGKAARFALPAATALLPSVSLGGIMTGLGTAAAAVGTVLASPVVITGAAIAAVGIGAYMLYKHFSDRPDGPIHRFRLAQYGVDPENKDHVAKLNALEDKLSGEVQYRKGQSPTLSEGLDINELVQITGVDPEDNTAVQNWALWFQRRFKPVFFSHMAVANELKSGIKSSDIDSTVDKEKKAEFIKRVQFKEGADGLYSTLASPFPDTDQLKGPGYVQSVYDEVLKDVKGQVNELKANAGRTFPNPENLGYDDKPENIQDVAPKKTSTVVAIAEDAERIRRNSPTNRIELAEKEAEQTVAKEKNVLSEEERFEQYEEERFDPMDVYRRQVARKAAYDRRGLPSDHIKIPTIHRIDEGESSEEELPRGNIQPTPKPIKVKEKSTRTWGQAMDIASATEVDDDERLVEERKRKESKVVKQTETQVASNTAQMSASMNRMVAILSDSHGVQKDIRDTLSTMNEMFKERYEAGHQEDGRRGAASTASREGALEHAARASGASQPVKKVRPVHNSR